MDTNASVLLETQKGEVSEDQGKEQTNLTKNNSATAEQQPSDERGDEGRPTKQRGGKITCNSNRQPATHATFHTRRDDSPHAMRHDNKPDAIQHDDQTEATQHNERDALTHAKQHGRHNDVTHVKSTHEHPEQRNKTWGQ